MRTTPARGGLGWWSSGARTCYDQPMHEKLFERFIQACAGGDFDALRALSSPSIRFRSATPLEARQAQG